MNERLTGKLIHKNIGFFRATSTEVSP